MLFSEAMNSQSPGFLRTVRTVVLENLKAMMGQKQKDLGPQSTPTGTRGHSHAPSTQGAFNSDIFCVLRVEGLRHSLLPLRAKVVTSRGGLRSTSLPHLSTTDHSDILTHSPASIQTLWFSTFLRL